MLELGLGTPEALVLVLVLVLGLGLGSPEAVVALALVMSTQDAVPELVLGTPAAGAVLAAGQRRCWRRRRWRRCCWARRHPQTCRGCTVGRQENGEGTATAETSAAAAAAAAAAQAADHPWLGVPGTGALYPCSSWLACLGVPAVVVQGRRKSNV